jgi:hypothetical protein
MATWRSRSSPPTGRARRGGIHALRGPLRHPLLKKGPRDPRRPREPGLKGRYPFVLVLDDGTTVRKTIMIRQAATRSPTPLRACRARVPARGALLSCGISASGVAVAAHEPPCQLTGRLQDDVGVALRIRRPPSETVGPCPLRRRIASHRLPNTASSMWKARSRRVSLLTSGAVFRAAAFVAAGAGRPG